MIDRLSRHLAFFAPAAVISAWATVMLHTIVAGHINRLLSPMFRCYVLVAAITLLLLSALHLFLYQPSFEYAPIASPRNRLRQMGRWFMLLIPVIAACVLSPSALSSTTAAMRTTNPTAGVAAMPNLSDTSTENAKAALDADPTLPVPMEVTDLITISRTPDLMKKFDGRLVKVVGLFNGGNPDKLMRWIMWCCAADAQPASIQMSGTVGGPWKNDQWLEVTGTARFPSTLGHVVPRIAVDTAKETTEPDEPFLSP